jgi:rhodanese-related sulfurtransferase
MTEFPRSITVAELAASLAGDDKPVLVDVREPWELEIVSIPGALSIPLQQLPARVAELPAKGPVVVFCHHGSRSAQAVAWLRRGGNDRAINLEGGIDSWAREVDRTLETY